MLIPWPAPLVEARLRARYDRFITELETADGEILRAHCVNPGRMEGLVRVGARCWLSAVPPESKRKLRYTLELMEIDGQLVGANTVAPNRLAKQLVEARQLPTLDDFDRVRSEVRYDTRSRIDLLLEKAGHPDHLVEVKNCHLVYPDDIAYFPDSVSARATEHLEALRRAVEAGRKATVLFVLQRPDGCALKPSRIHDPAFAEAAARAAQAGVSFTAVKLNPTLEGHRFEGVLPVDVTPYDPATLAPYRDAWKAYSGWKREKAVKAQGDA